MEKFFTPTISYWKRTFLSLIAIAMLLPPQAWAIDTVITSGSTVGQQTIANSNDTLTNSGTIDRTGSVAVIVNSKTGVTITNNAGATIQSSGSFTIRVSNNSTDLIIVNSGTIQTTGANQAIDVDDNSNFTLNNNAGGVISGIGSAINFVNVGGTINNSGTISTSASNGEALQLSSGTGMTINNNAGGVISAANIAVRFFQNTTLTNTGTISSDNLAINIKGNDNTIIFKEGSIIVGDISVDASLTGNKLQIDQGFGQAYFYETSGGGAGDLTLEDLSGNTIVKGSSGSVGQGANESVDELLGLRAFNLRSALKRYSAFPKQSGENELYAEPFSFYSKRGSNNTVLGYEAYGAGINFIYPLKQHKLDLILSVGHSELDLQGGHDISRNNFLAGVTPQTLPASVTSSSAGFLSPEWNGTLVIVIFTPTPRQPENSKSPVITPVMKPSPEAM